MKDCERQHTNPTQMPSDYIRIQEVSNLKKTHTELKDVSFKNVCCSWCCVITGFTGALFLGLFALCLYEHWYFEAAWTLPEVDTEIYNTKALMFLVGALFEAAVGVGSVFWVRWVLRRQAQVKAAREAKDD